MAWRSCFTVAPSARWTLLWYCTAAMQTRIMMIMITIINSRSVNPALPSPGRRFRMNDQPVQFCDSIFNSIPRPNYQSEYFVPSSAVPVDFEFTSTIPGVALSGDNDTLPYLVDHSFVLVTGSTGTSRR